MSCFIFLSIFCSHQLKNVKELCIRVCLSFFILFLHAKSGAINNHRDGLSDISYQNPVSLDSNDIVKFQKKICVEKNRFKILEVWSNFERVKRSSKLRYI